MEIECKDHKEQTNQSNHEPSEVGSNASVVQNKLDEMNAANDGLYYETIKHFTGQILKRLTDHRAVILLYDAHCGQVYSDCVESDQGSFIFEHKCPAHSGGLVNTNLISEECPFGLCSDDDVCHWALQIRIDPQRMNWDRTVSEMNLIHAAVEKIFIGEYLNDHLRLPMPAFDDVNFKNWYNGRYEPCDDDLHKYLVILKERVQRLTQKFEECYSRMVDFKPIECKGVGMDKSVLEFVQQVMNDRLDQTWHRMPDYYNAISNMMTQDIGLVKMDEKNSCWMTGKYIEMLLTRIEWELIGYVGELPPNHRVRQIVLKCMDQNAKLQRAKALKSVLDTLGTKLTQSEYIALRLCACLFKYRNEGVSECQTMLQAIMLQIEVNINQSVSHGSSSEFLNGLWDVYHHNWRLRKMLMMLVQACAPVLQSMLS